MVCVVSRMNLGVVGDSLFKYSYVLMYSPVRFKNAAAERSDQNLKGNKRN